MTVEELRHLSDGFDVIARTAAGRTSKSIVDGLSDMTSRLDFDDTVQVSSSMVAAE